MKRFTLLAVAIAFAFAVNAQNTGGITWQLRQSHIRQLFSNIDQLDDNQEITLTADTIMREMMAILSDVTFDFGTQLDQLPKVGCVVSDDGQLCMYSWNVSLRDENNTSQFYALCYSKTYDITYAFSSGNPRVPPEKGNIPESNWYGAMYYRIAPIKVNDNTVYLMLGYAPIDNNHQFKVIDVMTCNKRGVKFGANIFQKEDGKKYSRVVFQYGRNVQMSLEMDKKHKKIMFDHLSNMGTDANGRVIMGPDMSVDAYLWHNGMWVYKSDVDAKNAREPQKQ